MSSLDRLLSSSGMLAHPSVQVSQADAKRVWNSVGAQIARGLASKGGVTVSGLGRFQQTNEGARFVPAAQFLSFHGFQTDAAREASSGTGVALSMIDVAQQTGLPRDKVQAVIKEIFKQFGESSRFGDESLPIPNVGALRVTRGKLKFAAGASSRRRHAQLQIQSGQKPNAPSLPGNLSPIHAASSSRQSVLQQSGAETGRTATERSTPSDVVSTTTILFS